MHLGVALRVLSCGYCQESEYCPGLHPLALKLGLPLVRTGEIYDLTILDDSCREWDVVISINTYRSLGYDKYLCQPLDLVSALTNVGSDGFRLISVEAWRDDFAMWYKSDGD